MSLTRKDIEEIMGLLDASRFERLSLEMDGLKLELARSGATASAAPVASSVSAAPAPAPAAAPAQAAAAPVPTNTAVPDGLVAVKSPLLGVFYRAPKPGEASFVEVGSRVEEDSVIGIIEVMKLMNSARAGVAGEVVQILGTNGEMVEHGEVLMLIRPA
ncbi:acetyl-CoA carboxylase biotin carboxyl carrier protein [Altererythrobacter xixiisoli]|uniref:Biotin carboxyl carrier protein of acetyl-CoA carboxylase n=1 Tax=Croceibacterium xixiisoli TaxID=1476466 RepID=A0A6I4TTJ3_9SPHN|nr:acetyl-CoA carboxylase biotin carboxyl carrier protein [Croceibacterium xixiisoli]MXO99214.1 acetyl-CoA carboxylase biotin carboxyl carrier protein [Croceibacterium xixiisoli]